MPPHDTLPPVQMSLFPDGHELVTEALAALRDLCVSRARAVTDRARRLAPDLVNLGFLEQAVALLESRLGAGPPTPERLADVVLAVRDEALAGRLGPEAAAFIDKTIARHDRRSGCSTAFVDGDARVHRAVLHLILGEPEAARAGLIASLQGSCQDRADLWGYRGDAAWASDLAGEANACYVRGLLLAASDVDLWRIRHRDLAHLYGELAALHGAGAARELLLVHGWLRGLLDIPPDNDWLDGQLARLEARARTGPDTPQQRWRRFALLLYLDRSRPVGRCDERQREEMLALDGELFARYLARCQERERAH